MEHRIEKHIDINAPVSRVWQALTDHRQFGEWFRAEFQSPFAAGQPARGRILHPGFEHLTFEIKVRTIEPETYFSFTWHPYAIDPKTDYSREEPTLVEFRLANTANGTRVTVSETGFDKIPENRRAEAFRMNSQGWAQQMENIKAYAANKD